MMSGLGAGGEHDDARMACVLRRGTGGRLLKTRSADAGLTPPAVRGSVAECVGSVLSLIKAVVAHSQNDPSVPSRASEAAGDPVSLMIRSVELASQGVKKFIALFDA
ncbi:MAG: hypothetical protein ACI9MR_002506 [Myxococcota bacterium]|jgi:hypothetical protein